MKLVGSKSAVRSPEFHKRKQRERVLKTLVLSIVLIAVLVSPVYMLRHEKFLISGIDIRGNEVTPDQEIADIAGKYLAGKYLWLIPKSNFLLVDEDDIEKDLMTTIPRLASVNADVEGTNTLVIEITERRPFALYCEDVVDAGNPSKCFFLDDTGNIFSHAPDFSGSVYMIYNSEPTLEEPLRKQLIEPGEFREINNFLSKIPDFGLDPRVIIKRGGEYATVLESGTELKWKSGQDLVALASDLNSFLKDSKIKQTAFGDLLYIDLRFDNKVFYRFRNQ
jgi:hypothetical protein